MRFQQFFLMSGYLGYNGCQQEANSTPAWLKAHSPTFTCIGSLGIVNFTSVHAAEHRLGCDAG